MTDQRTKNRLQEHSQPGHELGAILSRNSVQCLGNKPGTLFLCSCGWVGWLPIDSSNNVMEF